MKTRLNQNATTEVYEVIMADPRWPQESFINVAHFLFNTTPRKQKQSDAHHFLKAKHEVVQFMNSLPQADSLKHADLELIPI